MTPDSNQCSQPYDQEIDALEKLKEHLVQTPSVYCFAMKGVRDVDADSPTLEAKSKMIPID